MSEEAPSCPAGPEGMARAMGYMQEVQKRLLPERDETYQQFLKIFADYANGGRSIDEMQTCVKDLFKDERDLVDGFEKFLPKNNPRREGADVEVTKEGGLVK